MEKIHLRYRYILILILIILFMTLSIISPYFFTVYNFNNILNQSVVYILLAIGMTYVICLGGIDVSIGSSLALTAVVGALIIKLTDSVFLGIISLLILSLLLGLINGQIIAKIKINPFIATICTMSIFRGICVLITDGKPVYGFPNSYLSIASGKFLGVNISIILVLCITFIAAIVLKRTKLGTYILAIGDNETAAIKCGINPEKIKKIVYCISAVCAGIAGLIMSSRLNTAEPLAGFGYEMNAIAASVLGGANIKGGEGDIIDTFLACLILATISNGLQILSISSSYQQVLTGIIIIVTIAFTNK